MSITFNWFKYAIVKRSSVSSVDYYHWYGEKTLVYKGGGNTSHSAGNISIVQELISKYGDGKQIPYVNTCDIGDSFTVENNLDPILIKPNEMSSICDRILAETEVDASDMRDRIEWFKDLSDDGYYLTYDAD